MNSMTGFGVYRGKVGRSHIMVETRSVNHRFCEVNLRFPGRFASFEGDVSRRIRERFSRGKFDLYLREETLDREEVELSLARRAHHVLKRIKKDLHLSGDISLTDVLTFRGMMGNQSVQEEIESLRQPLMKVLEVALAGLETMRQREGARLQKWFLVEFRHLSRLIKSISLQVGRQGQEGQKRFENRLKRLSHMTEERLLQEKAIMAEKADVTEEIVRLQSHMKEFDRLLHEKVPVGRKFDFLIQEMGREINTIGSKAQGVKVSHQVIEFKSELERVREQIQNVE